MKEINGKKIRIKAVVKRGYEEFIVLEYPDKEELLKVNLSFGHFHIYHMFKDDPEDLDHWQPLATMFSSYKKVEEEFWDYVPD